MNTGIDLVIATPGHPLAWKRARKYLQQAIERGSEKAWTIFDVYEMFRAGLIDVWLVLRDGKPFAALATEVRQYPKRRTLDILLFGSDSQTESDWLKGLEILKVAAQRHGCCAIIGEGRPGWARKLGATDIRRFEVSL